MNFFNRMMGGEGGGPISEVRIETERLILRHGRPSDVVAVVDYLKSNREFHRPYEPRRPELFYTEKYWEQALREDVARYRTDSGLRLFLFPRGRENMVVGTVHFNNIVRGAFHACHLGYMLDQQQQGKGLMHEALEKAIGFVFEPMNLHRIMANYLPENQRSAKLLERLGFRREGIAKDYLLIDGQWRDHVLTSLVSSRWKG